MATGGDVIEATYNHPDLGTGTFFFKSNEDNNFDLGGYRSSDDTNMLDGGGNMIDIINQVRWKFEGTISWDMNITNELDLIVGLAGSPKTSDWTFSHSNGTTWGANGKPVGDYSGAGNSAGFPIIISGGGKLKKIG